MKKIYLMFLVLLLSFLGWSQTQTITIGTGTSTQIYPLGSYYGYERSVSLYTSSEIGYSGDITQLGWDADTGNLGDRPIKIYLKETTETSLSSTDWSSMINGATLVYDDDVDPAVGWNDFITTSTFNYSGTSNLLVLVEANYGGSGLTGSSGNSIKYSTATNRHMYIRADNSPPTSNGTITNNRP